MATPPPPSSDFPGDRPTNPPTPSSPSHHSGSSAPTTPSRRAKNSTDSGPGFPHKLLPTMLSKACREENNLLQTLEAPTFSTKKATFLRSLRSALNGIKLKMDQQAAMCEYYTEKIEEEKKYFASTPWGYESGSIRRMNELADERSEHRKVEKEYTDTWRVLWGVRERVKGMKMRKGLTPRKQKTLNDVLWLPDGRMIAAPEPGRTKPGRVFSR